MQGACRAMTACNSRRSSAGKREELAASSLQSWCPPDRSCVRRQSFSIKATRSSLPAYPSLHRPMQHTDSPDRAPQAITGSPDPFYTNELQGVVFPARLQGQALGTGSKDRLWYSGYALGTLSIHELRTRTRFLVLSTLPYHQ
jgi:hypothetical protein